MIKPKRIRFDDAITTSRDPKLNGREVQKFFKNVNWCIRTNVQLTPAILCQSINQFPEAIDQLREMTAEGIIYPDLHGWDHGPYDSRSLMELDEHLSKSQEWFKQNLEVAPIRWVTPHGANSPAMQEIASKHNLVLETTDYPVVDQKALDRELRFSRDLQVFNDIVVMVHWWERGLRLYRIAKIIEYQNIKLAIENTKSELNKKEHRICWGEWIE